MDIDSSTNSDVVRTSEARMQEALEQPASWYLERAQQPDIANALEQFKSESEIRKTGRLDLVAWVQYICAFGYDGPTNDAWDSLFIACQIYPKLSGQNQCILGEEKIAVLLAYAKIRADPGDTMTPAQLIKQRIRPAVQGRSVARTPGILKHIHAKFEAWALGSFSDQAYRILVDKFSPNSYLPGADELPPSWLDQADNIRECATAHAHDQMKLWAGLISSILDINEYEDTPRAQRFHAKLIEKRVCMFHHFFSMIHEHLLNMTRQSVYMPDDSETPLYREYPYHHHSEKDQLLVVHDTTESKLVSFMKKMLTRKQVRPYFPSWSIIETEVTIAELHKPSRLGLAGLNFIRTRDLRKSIVKMKSTDAPTSFTASKTNLRIGTFDSDTLLTEVHGVPPSQMCRALKLKVKVGLLPPKGKSSRPQFQILELIDAYWEEIQSKYDQCEEREPMTDMGMEHDEVEDDDSTDRVHQWLCRLGIGHYLAVGGGVRWEQFDMCEGMTKHEIKVNVPGNILRKLRMQSQVETQVKEKKSDEEMEDTKSAREDSFQESCTSIDLEMESEEAKSETFSTWCWVDCYAAAQITYFAPAGVEIFAASQKEGGIFANAPAWKSRTA